MEPPDRTAESHGESGEVVRWWSLHRTWEAEVNWIQMEHVVVVLAWENLGLLVDEGVWSRWPSSADAGFVARGGLEALP